MTTLKLTATEQNIRQILLEVSDYIRKTQDTPVTLRIAGGWVRDKLLGKESKDLDIALDTMTGYSFALAINKYLSEKGENEVTIAKIESNPDKSKHLETATLRLCGQFVDFVNLRTEIYQSNSRVPEIMFGSPMEDALRRDITINSLFYNLHSEKVEDFTAKGLDDLKAKIIRTPLEPLQTFIDDPLRILRVIRFASRLDYQISPEIVEAVLSHKVHEPFLSKISRERVGVEVSKMLSSNDPLRALRLIVDFDFYDLVFLAPEKPADRTFTAIGVARGIDWLLNNEAFTHQLAQFVQVTQWERMVLFLAAAVYPFRGLQLMDEKGKPQPVPRWMMLNSLKLSLTEADTVKAVVELAEKVDSFVMKSHGNHPSRKELGLVLKEIAEKPLGKLWPMAFVVAAAGRIAPCMDPSPQEPTGHGHPASHGPLVESTIEQYIGMFHLIRHHNLSHIHEIRPLVDVLYLAKPQGKRLATLLGIRPGPAIGALLEKVLHWQLENEQARVAQCEEWIKTVLSQQPLDLEALGKAPAKAIKKPRVL